MRDLCARFEVNRPDAPAGKGVIYVKSRWFPTKFSLWVTDGLNAWFGGGEEGEVLIRAFSWDCPVTEYLQVAEKYLAVQDPNSNYSFISQGDEARKLSWTLNRDGVQLAAIWRVEKAVNPREITCDVLDFLMTGSSRLSEELQRKRRSFDQMKAEAERCLAQNAKFRDEKIQFEEEVFKKFVAVLNSKKDKIRELNEQVLRSEESTGTSLKEEPETESEDQLDDYDAEDDYASKEDTAVEATEKDAAPVDSGATEILPSDSLMDDVSSRDPGSSRSPPHEPESNAPVAQTSSSQHATEPFADASALLSGSTYTSAPRKRRHQ